MEILVIVVSIISAICVWRLIGFGVRSANKLNATSAATLQMTYDALAPEAKARVDEAREARDIKARKAQKRRLAIVGIGLVIFLFGYFAIAILHDASMAVSP